LKQAWDRASSSSSVDTKRQKVDAESSKKDPMPMKRARDAITSNAAAKKQKVPRKKRRRKKKKKPGETKKKSTKRNRAGVLLCNNPESFLYKRALPRDSFSAAMVGISGTATVVAYAVGYLELGPFTLANAGRSGAPAPMWDGAFAVFQSCAPNNQQLKTCLDKVARTCRDRREKDTNNGLGFVTSLKLTAGAVTLHPNK